MLRHECVRKYMNECIVVLYNNRPELSDPSPNRSPNPSPPLLIRPLISMPFTSVARFRNLIHESGGLQDQAKDLSIRIKKEVKEIKVCALQPPILSSFSVPKMMSIPHKFRHLSCIALSTEMTHSLSALDVEMTDCQPTPIPGSA
jgi:hypothetical protein